jgi:hypothetical protein
MPNPRAAGFTLSWSKALSGLCFALLFAAARFRQDLLASLVTADLNELDKGTPNLCLQEIYLRVVACHSFSFPNRLNWT